MKRILLLLVLAGCGGSDPGERYLSGTWTQENETANIRLWDFGDRVEGWTDDGRRVSGNWPRLVLGTDSWERVAPFEYTFGGVRARLVIRG